MLVAWGSSRGGNEKWLDTGYSLKVKSSGFANRLDEGCKRQEGIKDDTNIFWSEQLTVMGKMQKEQFIRGQQRLNFSCYFKDT